MLSAQSSLCSDAFKRNFCPHEDGHVRSRSDDLLAISSPLFSLDSLVHITRLIRANRTGVCVCVCERNKTHTSDWVNVFMGNCATCINQHTHTRTHTEQCTGTICAYFNKPNSISTAIREELLHVCVCVSANYIHSGRLHRMRFLYVQQ